MLRLFPKIIIYFKSWLISDAVNVKTLLFTNGIICDHNEELHSLCRSPDIVRVNKPRRLRWAGHVDRMEEGRSAFKILTDRKSVV